MNIHEEKFALAFVIPEKRERYLSMLQSSKARRRLLAKFPHCADLNMRDAIRVPSGEQHLDAIEKSLRQKGAPENCFVISADGEIDNQEMPLRKALEQTVGMNMGTFISCVPGKLGYFEFEDLGERYIFEA
jgi:hypothetical protein